MNNIKLTQEVTVFIMYTKYTLGKEYHLKLIDIFNEPQFEKSYWQKKIGYMFFNGTSMEDYPELDTKANEHYIFSFAEYSFRKAWQERLKMDGIKIAELDSSKKTDIELRFRRNAKQHFEITYLKLLIN